MRVPQVVLRFPEQLSLISSVLADELQQLVSAIQIGFSSLTGEINSIESGWTDVGFISANYAPNTAGLLSIAIADRPYVFRYKVIGATLFLHCTATLTINNATTTEVRFRIPAGFQPMGLKNLTGTSANMERTACVFSDSTGIAGVAMAAINVTGRYISVQRSDGALGAAFTNGSSTIIGFMVQVPLV